MSKRELTKLIDLVEAVLGKRTAFLTVGEFAQITNTHPVNIRERCARDSDFAQQAATGKHYRIPVERLAEYVK
nr:MAG TPA: Protein of unknown function (DUF1580) [Caudoviricetes sp.]